MELGIGGGGRSVFILDKNIEDDQRRIEMKVWNVDTLEEVKMEIPRRINKQRVHSIDLLANNAFMAVTYSDQNAKWLQEVEIIQTSDQRTVFAFDPRFSDTTGLPKDQMVRSTIDGKRIFPLRLFIDSTAGAARKFSMLGQQESIQQGVTSLVGPNSAAGEALAQRSLKFKILFMSDLKLDFVSAESDAGHPLFLVDFTLDELVKNKSQQSEFILDRALAVFEGIFKDQESLSSIETIEGIGAKIFMLDEGYLKWPGGDVDIKSYTDNPIEYTAFEVNSLFDHLALINNEHMRAF
jgi:hypothetical protein